MRLGVGSYAYRWAIGIGDTYPPAPLTPAGLVRRTRDHGLSLVQIADNLQLHRQSEVELAELARTAKELGVSIELGVGSISPPLMRSYVELARRFGAKLIRIAPDQSDAAKSVRQLAADLCAVLPEARAAGAVLAIENHFHLPSPKLLEILEVVGDPAVGICLDVANSIAVGEWPEETIDMLVPHTLNLHLKDFRIAIDPYGVGMTFTGIPLGQGRLDVAAVFSALRRHGRDVSVILEHWLPKTGTIEAAIAAEDDWLTESIVAARRAIFAADLEGKRDAHLCQG